MRNKKSFIGVLTVAVFFISNQAMALVSGQLLWEQQTNAQVITINKNNKIYVAGKNVINKYSTSGKHLWERTLNNIRVVSDIATNNNGNIYVGGTVNKTEETKTDINLIKFDSLGNRRWARRFNGKNNGWDYLASVALDSKGNIYLGAHSGKGLDRDFLILKYDYKGNLIWKKYDSYTQASNDATKKLMVDKNDNLLILGTSAKLDSNDQTAVLTKYDSSGNKKWRRHFSDMYVVDMEIDPNNNVVISTLTQNYPGDYVVIKHSPAGKQLWMKTNKTNSWEDNGDLFVDNEGNIYLAGETMPYAYENGTNIYTAKYDTNGKLKWSKTYDGKYDNNEYHIWKYFASERGLSIIAGNNNSVYVTGMSFLGDKRGMEITTIKYDSEGKQRWVRRYGDSSSGDEAGYGIAKDSNGNIYVIGSYTNGLPNSALLKYAP